ERLLVRYGTISEVARFSCVSTSNWTRGDQVVVRTRRGLELGTLLEDPPRGSDAKSAPSDDSDETCIVRRAGDNDAQMAQSIRHECEQQFDAWRRRIETWRLQLELIDLEWMLDRTKLVIYVLNDRGPECTKLALQAAAAGLGIIEVQPVGAEGLITLP